MIDLEAALQKALVAPPPAFDEAQMTRAVTKRLVARKRKRVIGMAGIALIGVVALYAFARPQPHREARRLPFLRGHQRPALHPLPAAHDAALFAEACALYDENRDAEAQPLLQRILDETASSSYAPNAAVARGDALFDDKQLDEALHDYALVPHGSALYAYALDKIGWVHVNKDETDAAIAAFEEVVALSQSGKLEREDQLVVAESANELAVLEARRSR